jgi:hypothetical protein
MEIGVLSTDSNDGVKMVRVRKPVVTNFIYVSSKTLYTFSVIRSTLTLLKHNFIIFLDFTMHSIPFNSFRVWVSLVIEKL